ncbi:MAG: ACT domain-containing protein [Candidatus Micrarchaeota archaeon]
MKSITIVADDKVGLLADISYVLAKSKINIDTINVDVVGGKAIISLGISDPAKGKQVVEAAGYKVEDPNAVVIKLPDKPGELNRITNLLSKEGVNIQNVHTLTKDSVNTVLSVVVDKPKRAALILQPHLITNESTY